MTVERWLAAAEADAERRGMPELKPLLQGLAAATRALRAGDWNDARRSRYRRRPRRRSGRR